MTRFENDEDIEDVVKEENAPSPPAAELDPSLLLPGDAAAFREGHRDAVERVFKACWPRMYRAAFRILAARDDSEEAAQEGFVRAHAARTGFRGLTEAELGAWLVSIVRNIAIDTLRRRTRRADMPDEVAGPAQDDPATKVEAAETCREVRAALESLEPGDRAAIVLFEVEELPQIEIAAGMKITVGALKVRLHRARRRFREAYLKLISTTRRDGERHV